MDGNTARRTNPFIGELIKVLIEQSALAPRQEMTASNTRPSFLTHQFEQKSIIEVTSHKPATS